MERRKFTREFKLTAVRKVVDLGVRCSENTVAKGMKQAGILVVGAKRFRVRTTDSQHNLPIAENALK